MIKINYHNWIIITVNNKKWVSTVHADIETDV